jgi:hypothetical protein
MTGDFERTRSRVEIDARARVARVALERDALAAGTPARRRFTLQDSLADWWRQLVARQARNQRQA